jgi:hypothetical protein
MSALGICTAKVTKWRCMRGVMLKEPAVGFMHAAYWQLVISLSTIFCLSYLLAKGGRWVRGGAAAWISSESC